MKATLERREGHTAYVRVEVEPEEVTRALERASRQIARRLVIPGFRPGRAPRALVERRVGREALVEEALEHLLPEAYARAVELTGIEPIDRPRIEDLGRLEEGQPLTFRAVVTVRPEVELPDYRALRVAPEPVQVEPEHVERVLERLRQQHATLVPVDDPAHAVQPGDVVTLDFRGEDPEGQPVAGARGEGVLAEVGADQLRPEFERHLLGMRAGEERTFELTFLDDDPEEALRGRTVRFTVRVRDIRRKELPALDDDFAAVLGYGSVEDLRRDVQNRLQHRLAADAEQRRREQVLRQVVEGARVDVPDVLVERRVDELVDDLRRDLERQGTSLEAYLSGAGKDLEQLRAELRPRAEQAVRTELVLDAIARRERIAVTEADLAREAELLARGSGRTLAEIRRLLRHPEVRRRVVADILARKTVERLAQLTLPEPPDAGRPHEDAADPRSAD